jgi:ABC-type polysaccharide/polyol phosphate transport system ATPase subunit
MSSFIELENVTLDIPIFDVARSFRRSLFNYCTGGQIMQDSGKKNMVNIRALENINFRLEKGDRLGLVGHNGAGKTTLLRVLAGVYTPLIGKMRSNGKITPLFNISIGMDLDDTGIENISTIGMYLGMTPKEIEDRKEEIISFSELGDFINLPVRTYSSGMMVRLSFAIATSLQPEVLLMDEGIGAGDAQFAEKAKARLDEFYRNIDILVIASHGDDLIRQLCNKAMLLEHGKVMAFGEVEAVLEQYHRSHSS